MAFSRDPNFTAGALTNDEIKHRILDIFATFVSDVEPTPMSDWLIQEKVISTEQWLKICHKNPTSRSQCRDLLVHLFSIQHPKAFLFVRQALIKENHYLLELIDSPEPGCGIREQPDNQTVLQAATVTTMKTTFGRKGERVVTHKTEPIEHQKSGDESKQTTKLDAEELEFQDCISILFGNLDANIQDFEIGWKLSHRSAKTQLQSGKDIKKRTGSSVRSREPQLEKNYEDQKSARKSEKELEDRLLQLQENIEFKQHEIKQLETEVLETKLQLDKLRHKSNTILVHTLRIKATKEENASIQGLTILDNELFVVICSSSKVEVYDSMNFSLSRPLKVEKLSDPIDIGSCNRNKCLYILDYKGKNKSNEIFRVDRNGKLIKKWSTDDYYGTALSVADESDVILTVPCKNKLNEYSPDGQLIREIILSSDAGIHHPRHAIKLTDGDFVVSHGFNSNDLHRVCVVDGYGKLIKSFGGECGSDIGQMDRPVYLAVDGNGFVMVADRDNSRVLLLDSDLKFMREILSKETHELRDPMIIQLDKSNGRLFVADNKYDSDKKVHTDGRILIFEFQ